MPDGGELKAVFKGIQEPLAQAVEDAGSQAGKLGDDTMEKATASLDSLKNVEDANLDSIHGLGDDGAGGTGGSGSGGSEGGRSDLDKMLNGEGPPAAAPEASKSGSRKLPDYIQKRIDAGNEFNRQNRPRYAPNNEIALENGKIVDSYRPNREIVERKHTQLGKIKKETAKSYIDSLRHKYKQGTLIKNSAKNKELGLGGKKLRGKHILEVPKQDSPVPSSILEHAAKHHVIIRDVSGQVYRLPKGEEGS